MRRLRIVAVLAGVGLLAMPAAATAAKKKKGPTVDLKVVVLQTNFGDPAFSLVNPNGMLEPIDIRVGVKNQGKHDAPPFTVDVFFQDSARHHFEKLVKFPKLKAHTHPHLETVELTGRPKLGFAQVGAVADNDEKLNDVDRANNFFKGERFAIIARQWNVSDFETIDTEPGAAARTTSAGAGFSFQFSSFDHSKAQYVYQPMGPITSTSTYGGFCTGVGSLTVTHTPWAGFLHLSGDFRYYDAFVQADPTKYPVTITCLGGITTTAMNGFDNLDTSADGTPPVTNEQAAKVSGDFPDASKRIEWKWQFQAAGR